MDMRVPTQREPVGARRGCVVACVDEAGRLDHVVDAAIERARRGGARLILYVADAAHRFSSARPTVWSADGARYAHPLDPVELFALGQERVALAVARAREAGVDAYGWLPGRRGAGELARYADEQCAGVILVAASQTRLVGALARWERRHPVPHRSARFARLPELVTA